MNATTSRSRGLSRAQSRGFISLGPILLLVIGLAVIGGGGWYVSQQGASFAEMRGTSSTTPGGTDEMNVTTPGNISTFQDQRTGFIGYWLRTQPATKTSDIATLSPKAGYMHDGTHVYYGPTLIPSADLKSFATLFSGYETNLHAKDNHAVYFKSTVIQGADPTTFVVLGIGIYAKDKNHVYSTDSSLTEAVVVPGVDPATAKAPEFILSDKNGPYEGKPPLQPTPTTLKTYTNAQYGYSLQYPNDFALQSDAAQAWWMMKTPPQFRIINPSSATQEIVAGASVNPADVAECIAGGITVILENGVTFRMTEASDPATGQEGLTHIYATVHSSTCYKIRTGFVGTALGHMETQAQKDAELKKRAEVFARLDAVAKSFRFTN